MPKLDAALPWSAGSVGFGLSPVRPWGREGVSYDATVVSVARARRHGLSGLASRARGPDAEPGGRGAAHGRAARLDRFRRIPAAREPPVTSRPRPSPRTVRLRPSSSRCSAPVSRKLPSSAASSRSTHHAQVLLVDDGRREPAGRVAVDDLATTAHGSVIVAKAEGMVRGRSTRSPPRRRRRRPRSGRGRFRARIHRHRRAPRAHAATRRSARCKAPSAGRTARR